MHDASAAASLSFMNPKREKTRINWTKRRYGHFVSWTHPLDMEMRWQQVQLWRCASRAFLPSFLTRQSLALQMCSLSSPTPTYPLQTAHRSVAHWCKHVRAHARRHAPALSPCNLDRLGPILSRRKLTEKMNVRHNSGEETCRKWFIWVLWLLYDYSREATETCGFTLPLQTVSRRCHGLNVPQCSFEMCNVRFCAFE